MAEETIIEPKRSFWQLIDELNLNEVKETEYFFIHDRLLHLYTQEELIELYSKFEFYTKDVIDEMNRYAGINNKKEEEQTKVTIHPSQYYLARYIVATGSQAYISALKEIKSIKGMAYQELKYEIVFLGG